MNCIIVEDEPAAQSILENHISLCPGLTCSGIFRDALSAQEYLDSNTVDLMFLDINLPEMSGISFLRSLVHPPLVIFTTAYTEYAIDGFDLEIVDFLLKPFSFERFCKAVNKAKEKFTTKAPPETLNKITIDTILFVEACGDYVSIVCTDKKLVVHGTLKSWEEKLKSSDFQKVHRTTIVNLQRIDHIEGNQIYIGQHKLPIAEPYKPQLLEKIFK
jgi:two-component system, LytTR family, response regulator LytT